MDTLFVRLGFVFILVFIMNLMRRIARNKSPKKTLRMPTTVQKIGLYVLIVLTFLMVLLVIVGLLTGTNEMWIVSAIIAVIFGTLIYFSRRKFNSFYEENDEYFILKDEYWAFKMYYDDISDWSTTSKEIGVYGPTENEKLYIYINYSYAEPEILLRKLTEMTLDGKFYKENPANRNDPNRIEELKAHLQKNNYDYILDQFSE